MKASSLIKNGITLETIYNDIENANKCGNFKLYIPHFIYVDENTKLKLIDDGFKLYYGDWDGIIKGALIIEW